MFLTSCGVSLVVSINVEIVVTTLTARFVIASVMSLYSRRGFKAHMTDINMTLAAER